LYFSSFIVFAFEQKCQAKGQKLKLDNIEVCTIISLVSLDKKKTTNTFWYSQLLQTFTTGIF